MLIIVKPWMVWLHYTFHKQEQTAIDILQEKRLVFCGFNHSNFYTSQHFWLATQCFSAFDRNSPNIFIAVVPLRNLHHLDYAIAGRENSRAATLPGGGLNAIHLT